MSSGDGRDGKEGLHVGFSFLCYIIFPLPAVEKRSRRNPINPAPENTFPLGRSPEPLQLILHPLLRP